MKIVSFVLLFAAASVAVLAQDDASSVRVAPVRKASEASRYEIPGRLEPIEEALIYTRATGIVRERRFEIGDRVKEGDELAVIDAPEIDRATDAAKAGVEQAKARAANARSLFNRSTRLLKSDVVSKEESEQRQTDTLEAAAAVRVAEAELARLEELRRFSTVRAPFDGVISARNIDRGDHTRGDASGANDWLYRLSRLDRLRFVISAPPDLALRLADGAEANVTFAEFPGREFRAKADHASRVFEAGSGTMRVEAILENPDLLLPGGLTGTAQFVLPPASGAFLAPSNALITREGKTLVACAREGKVRFVEVKPGRTRGRDAEVSSAELSENDLVILNPNAMLREGDAVSAVPLQAAK